ncbi:MAG TPA: phosphoenolpyruvate kinase [Thermoanaerobaculia bacterium]|nr:phosphoenolpyruvate kinase [Thermoanaerobaculia bacterium]
MKTTLTLEELNTLSKPLEAALVPFMKRFPGSAGERQPVHTVYGGAHLFKHDTARKLGEKARQVLDEHGVDPFTFARAIDLPDLHAEIVWQRVVEKLAREPIEDFRIDFEDGYGNRPDEEEDKHASIVAEQLVLGMNEGTLPPFIGIRIKPFSQELLKRGLRTVDIVLTNVLEKTGGTLPSNFVVTLPKIQLPEQVTLLADVFDAMESRLGLAPNTLRLEFMIETTQSILSERGESNLPRFLDAARGRATAAHFGTYDYTASCNITASEQRMDHPACDFARHMMQVAYSGTGLWLSDGATNILPIGDRETIHRAWKLHVDHIRHSLIHAYYQGWDLHPAQLPTRYAAVYSFFLGGLSAATERLRNFMEKAGQATLVGDVFDDAATGQGLLNYFLRGMNSGALTEQEALASGLTLHELRSRSFVKILAGRRQG